MECKTNPPIPHEVGSVTFKAADVATAASAGPPSERLEVKTKSKTYLHFRPYTEFPILLVLQGAENMQQFLCCCILGNDD